MKLFSKDSSIMAAAKNKIMTEYIPESSLFISEPNPYMFGNPANRYTKHWTNDNWLKSRFHFSFAEYRNPAKNNFGVLRVMNDDLVQPSRGFGVHPHSNMEIVTYVVDGQLTHEDSTGNKESLGRGSAQFMSAGTGLYHSEKNESEDTPCRFIQMWILPKHTGLDVNYGSFKGDSDAAFDSRWNQWMHLVSDVANTSKNTPVKIHQDANIYIAEFDSSVAGGELKFRLNSKRQGYLLIVESIEGQTTVRTNVTGLDTFETIEANQHDALKLFGPLDINLSVQPNAKSHVLIVEMSS